MHERLPGKQGRICMRATACAAVSAFLVLTACGEKPPNTTVSGVVASAKRMTPSSRSLLAIFDKPYYSLNIRNDQGSDWYLRIEADRIPEDDVRRTISQRVTFTCYRGDQQSSACPAQSLLLEGRELIRPTER
jgi:hypothetical protein